MAEMTKETEDILFDILHKRNILLYQYFTKEHMECNLGIKISKKKWSQFIEDYQENFGSESVDLAKNLWEDFESQD